MVDDKRIAILPNECQCDFPILGHPLHEIDPDRLLGSQTERPPQRGDRIEHGADRTRKRRGILHGRRADRGAASPDKSRSVRFTGGFIDRHLLHPLSNAKAKVAFRLRSGDVDCTESLNSPGQTPFARRDC